MPQPLLQSLRLSGFLSFQPGSERIDLAPLNVLIGPNGSGKSNLIEAIELLHATEGDLAAVLRLGGAPSEWIWRGEANHEAEICAKLTPPLTTELLSYRLALAEVNYRLEIVDEAIETAEPRPGDANPRLFYNFRRGQPVIAISRRTIFCSEAPVLRELCCSDALVR